MNYTGFGSPVQTRHRVFVSYHHGRDQNYYDTFSRVYHNTYESIYDNSLERQIDSDNVDYVIQRIRDNYITGTSCTIVLVGANTWGRKYVDWEIKATLDKEHGLIGVYLPTAPRAANGSITVPERLHDNVQSTFALFLSWEQIMAGAQQLDLYIQDAKFKDTRLIKNSSERRLRNA